MHCHAFKEREACMDESHCEWLSATGTCVHPGTAPKCKHVLLAASCATVDGCGSCSAVNTCTIVIDDDDDVWCSVVGQVSAVLQCKRGP